jgi:hypothetical protein
MSNDEQTIEITDEMVKNIRELIAGRDEINLEWLHRVTQIPLTVISQIAIQKLGMVVLEGNILTKEKAERKLEQMQTMAQSEVQREAFLKEPVSIDMMALRENLWTAMFSQRLFGQYRHQFCPIWVFLEETNASQILLATDWLKRFEDTFSSNKIPKAEKITADEIINEMGENFKGKAKIIFAQTKPRDSLFGQDKSVWVMFLITERETGIKLEGLNMINVLTLSTKFRSRERAFKAFDQYLELINFLVSDPSQFQEVILAE